jgi:hypothetical protein
MNRLKVIDYTCPKCNEAMEIGERSAGKTLPCLQCGAPVTVPAAAMPMPTQAEAADPTVGIGLAYKGWQFATKVARSDAGKAVMVVAGAAAALAGAWMGVKISHRR